MNVIGCSEATCVYCDRLITDNSGVEVLGERMHAACELKFRAEVDEIERCPIIGAVRELWGADAVHHD